MSRKKLPDKPLRIAGFTKPIKTATTTSHLASRCHFSIRISLLSNHSSQFSLTPGMSMVRVSPIIDPGKHYI